MHESIDNSNSIHTTYNMDRVCIHLGRSWFQLGIFSTSTLGIQSQLFSKKSAHGQSCSDYVIRHCQTSAFSFPLTYVNLESTFYAKSQAVIDFFKYQKNLENYSTK